MAVLFQAYAYCYSPGVMTMSRREFVSGATVGYLSMTKADRLLLDARAPRDATCPGGLGNTFDWRLLKNLDPAAPFMLSGGLNRDDVAVAIEMTGAGGSMSRPGSSARRAKRTPRSRLHPCGAGPSGTLPPGGGRRNGAPPLTREGTVGADGKRTASHR